MKTNNKNLKTQELKKEIHSFTKKYIYIYIKLFKQASCVLLLFLASENGQKLPTTMI